MPKGRYEIMRDYMPKVGRLGLDMMLRTCTVQVNLDFASEADMVRKFRVSLALQPIATALFANSPFTEGKPNGFLSYRSHIWTDTDPDRTGMLPFVFEDGFGFERYVDYVLDVPMYFVYRDGHYIDATGQSFRDFMDGRLPALPGEQPTHQRLGRPSDHASPRCGSRASSRCAAPTAAPWRRLCAPAGALGRPALRRRGARRRRRAGARLDRRGACRLRGRGAAHGAGDPVPQRHRRATSRARWWRSPRPGSPRRARIDWDGQDETALPRPPRADRRRRPHPGRGEAGALPRGLGRQGRSGVRGVSRSRAFSC